MHEVFMQISIGHSVVGKSFMKSQCNCFKYCAKIIVFLSFKFSSIIDEFIFEAAVSPQVKFFECLQVISVRLLLRLYCLKWIFWWIYRKHVSFAKTRMEKNMLLNTFYFIRFLFCISLIYFDEWKLALLIELNIYN